jgi:hypothetical protein
MIAWLSWLLLLYLIGVVASVDIVVADSILNWWVVVRISTHFVLAEAVTQNIDAHLSLLMQKSTPIAIATQAILVVIATVPLLQRFSHIQRNILRSVRKTRGRRRCVRGTNSSNIRLARVIVIIISIIVVVVVRHSVRSIRVVRRIIRVRGSWSALVVAIVVERMAGSIRVVAVKGSVLGLGSRRRRSGIARRTGSTGIIAIFDFGLVQAIF